MRRLMIPLLALGLIVALPVSADEEEREEIEVVVMNVVERGTYLRMNPKLKVQLAKGQAFELAGKHRFDEGRERAYYTVRGLNGDTFAVWAKSSSCVKIKVKMPSLKKQKAIYKHMAKVEKYAAALAKKNGKNNGKVQDSETYLEKRYIRELHIGAVKKYKLFYSQWEKIKATGDEKEWPKK